MTERPILFSAPMVRALLSGQKTQTRRVVKPDLVEGLDFLGGDVTDPDAVGVDIRWGEMQHDDSGDSGVPQWLACCSDYPEEGFIEIGKPYGAVGDRLWVRESYRLCAEFDDRPPSAGSAANRVWYEADAPHQPGFGKGRPSIHMPRWASRITLEIIGVRVERLQAISEDDARAEGITDGGCLNCGNPEVSCGCLNPKPDARDAFVHLWKSINGDESWDANPWVWVVEFRRLP